MIGWFLRCFCATGVVFLLVLGTSVQAEQFRVVEGEYIIEASESMTASGLRSLESVKSSKFSPVKHIGGTHHLVIKEGSSSLSRSNRKSRKFVNHNNSDNFCQELLASGEVKSCSPNFEVKAEGTPNDVGYSKLWGFHSSAGANVQAAWNLSKGSSSTVVAVIDTGIDYNHPDLKANMWINEGEIAGNGIDDDGNGYVDDVHGIAGSGLGIAQGNPMDNNGHGTHCAGTIGAVGNNGIGVVGVNWNVKLMALKFLDGNGSGALSDAIEVINYMVDMKERGVNVLVSNNSWGGGGFSSPMQSAVKRAARAGIIFAAAAGNSANNNDKSASYPAGYDVDNVVSVAAIDKNGKLASFSNYGARSVDIAAPGVGIYSTVPGGKYASFSGTSMATPHVAGALALLMSHSQSTDYVLAIDRLYNLARYSDKVKTKVATGSVLDTASMLGGDYNSQIPVCEASSSAGESIITDIPEELSPIIQADEDSYSVQDLGFSFPFFRNSYSEVTISPNGVIYFGNNVPAERDYENSEDAPDNSVAVFHTDLTTTSPGLGVFIKKLESSVVIYWKATHYSHQPNGQIVARAELFKDGNINVNAEFSSAELAELMKGKFTVGISGDGGNNTYASAEAQTDGFLVKFSQSCTIPEVTNRLRAMSVTSGSSTTRLKQGRKFNLNLYGDGDGCYSVKIELNHYVCEEVLPATLKNGMTILEGRLPKIGEKVKKVTFFSGNISAEAKVKKPASVSRRSRLANRKAARLCKKIAQSFN